MHYFLIYIYAEFMLYFNLFFFDNIENEMVVIAEETKNGYVISWEMDDANLSVVKVMWCIRRSADTCEVHNIFKETQLN